VKFADLPAGSRFKYCGEVFKKGQQNIALKADGKETMFHSDAEVELVKVAPIVEKEEDGNS
jgi:hypothetical protein